MKHVLETAAITLSLACLATSLPAQDLKPIALTITSTSSLVLKPGQKVTLRSTIRNIGPLSTPRSVESAYYWSDSLALVPRLATVLKTFTTPKLGPLQADTHNVEVTIPHGIGSKPYYLFVRADHMNQLLEPNELNNNRPLPVIGTNADLIVSLVVPSQVTAGTVVDATLTVGNLGTLRSGATKALLFAAKTPVIVDEQAVYLGSVSVGPLDGARTRSIPVKIELPHCLGLFSFAGVTSIGAIINPDDGNRVRESNLLNNTSPLLVRPTLSTKSLTRRIEWGGKWARKLSAALKRGPLLDATFDLGSPNRRNLCVTAPTDVLTSFVVVWSLSPNGFQFDPWSNLGLTLLNTSYFRNWFQTVNPNGSRDDIELNLPPLPSLPPFDLYLYTFYFNPINPGFANASIRASFVK